MNVLTQGLLYECSYTGAPRCSAQTRRVSNNYMLSTDREGEQQLHAQYRQEGQATITCLVQTGRVSYNYKVCTDRKGEQQLHAQYRQEG